VETKAKQRIMGVVILVLILIVVGIILFSSKKPELDQSQTIQAPDQTQNQEQYPELTTPQQPEQNMPEQQSEYPSDNQQLPTDASQPPANTLPAEGQLPVAPEASNSVLEPTATPESTTTPSTQPAASPITEDEAKPKTTTSAAKKPKTSTTKAKSTAKPKGDWTVQVASFSSSANSKKQQQQLVKAGYDAYVKSAKSSSGKTIYRVYVGHGISRSEVQKIISKLAEKYDLNGITSHYKS
jgi:cell division septation protein DedD